jgi:hypothetical protein
MLALVLTLTGCAGSTKYVSAPPTLSPPPAPLEEPCRRPGVLPGRAVSAGEAERLWSRDRAYLVDCAGRQKALVDWRQDRDERLAAPEPKTKAWWEIF